jgi:hypothetical protein
MAFHSSRDHAPGTCERCAEMAERIAWLESELGLTEEAAASAKIRQAFYLALDGRGGKGPSRVAMALYLARGRPLSRLQIMELIPPASGGDDERDASIVSVWVAHARKVLGRQAIATNWARGYYLTPDGMARVAAILEPQAVAA